MVPIPLAAAGAVAGAAYLNARFSLAHDLLFFRIAGASLLNILRAVRSDKINVFYVLEKQALDKSTAGRPFILFEGKSYTYAETYETVLRYGAWLREHHGVRERDIVALDYQNSDTFIFLWFAIWAIGAKPAFINYNLQGAALTHCLRASTSTLAIVDPLVAESVTDEVRQELPNMKFVVFAPEVEAEARSQHPVRYPDAVRSESEYVSMAILIYTSGTTGMPKPAVVSWAKIYMASMMSSKSVGLGPGEVLYTVSHPNQDLVVSETQLTPGLFSVHAPLPQRRLLPRLLQRPLGRSGHRDRPSLFDQNLLARSARDQVNRHSVCRRNLPVSGCGAPRDRPSNGRELGQEALCAGSNGQRPATRRVGQVQGALWN